VAELKRIRIAHRGGNDLARLDEVEALGVDLIEADVHLHRGRLEVRHLKTAGPLPLLWDRWRLANPFAPRLLLEQLLDRSGSRVQLMLDLKGRDGRLPGRVAEVTSHYLGRGPLTVCSRNWRHLGPFERIPNVRVVYSIGSRRQLRLFLRDVAPAVGVAGISIRGRLLTSTVARDLRARTPILMAWDVRDQQRMATLRAWGVNGLISDDHDLLGQFVDGPHKATDSGDDQ
jgi:glycerophosphoryl diester phosphodiesterase